MKEESKHKEVIKTAEESRLEMLEREQEILDRLMDKWSDPAMQKDVSENTDRDILLQQIQDQEFIVRTLHAQADIVHIPGTINVGDKVNVTFKRIVSYGKDQEVPKDPITVELVAYADITTVPLDFMQDPSYIFKLGVNSKMGEALLNKAHTSLSFETAIGFCEIEIERWPT